MRESTARTNHIDPARLSAYHDHALAHSEGQAVEAHLALCPTCRERLASYSWLGDALRADDGVSVPATLDRRVASLLQTGPVPARPWWLLHPAWAAAAVAASLLVALLFGFPFGASQGPAVAVAYPCDDPAMCAVAVRFTGPVDREGVERSLRIDPPVPVTVAWQGDTLLVKPTEPLEPTKGYTLSVQPQHADQAATPVALHFVAGGPASPVAMATRPGSTATPPAPPTASATPAGATPTPTAAATEADTPAPPPALCAVQPVRGFGALYQSQPSVASRLGCARAPERGVEMVAQPFQGGRLLWRADRKEIIALLEGGRWRSYPDTADSAKPETPVAGEPVRGFGKVWREQADLRRALGAPTAPEGGVGAVVEDFEQGLLIWTADRYIYALYADGTWERYADTFVDGTPTTAPTASGGSARTPTPVASLSATPTPSPAASPTAAGASGTPVPTSSPSTPRPTPVGATPASSPAAPTCQVQPLHGFGAIYGGNPSVAARLGCARGPESALQLGRQVFERGSMLWRADTREILVLRGDGTWSTYADTWQPGEALGDGGTPPAGRIAPDRGFGKLWRQQPEVRPALGWATAPEQPLAGAVQDFAGGRMLWTADRVIYVLYPDGTWQSFADTYEAPTATVGAP